VQRADVASEAGQAQRVGDGRRDVVPEMVQTGGNLPGREAGPLGHQDAHEIKYSLYAYSEYKRRSA
jgi:hypothetical protein